MDIAELALDYIRVLIWPAVVVFFMWTFRTKVAELLERLSELGGGGFSAKFDQAARTLGAAQQKAAEQVDAQEATTPPPPDDLVILDLHAFKDSFAALRAYKQGKTVDVDLSALPSIEAIQALGYLTGAVHATDGRIVSDKDSNRRYVMSLQGLATGP